MKWLEKYNTGFAEIDEQHQQLFALLTALQEANQSGQPAEAIDGILAGLIDYATFHFGCEEKILERLGCADIEAHKAKHQEFMGQVRAMTGHYASGQTGIDHMLMMFLKNWLVRHILVDDADALAGQRAFMPWSTQYVTGVGEVDAQHKEIFGLVNELYEARRDGASPEVLRRKFRKLDCCIRQHMAAEEAIMQERGYAALQAHGEAHNIIRAEMDEMLARIQSGLSQLDDAFLMNLKSYFLQHIIDDDRDAFSGD